ncbi:hypothetical protein FI667_g2755, partial [Globisporangium splendens]
MQGAGRKREWRPMEGEHQREDRLGARGAHGEVIEKEMKKLRLAQDYDASQSVWHPAYASSEDQSMEDANDADHNYAARNNVLRECHYLRQLRKFQSERVRERASHFERRNAGFEAQTQYLHDRRY